ncbi:MAG TPA: transcriptional repressor [Vicinamibacterales bacterium]|nr:transcriptional repressor [Vicinamibacterales bacterium]
MDFSGLRPAGGKRSSKRDRIVTLFLAQKEHLTADELYDLARRDDAGIGRATVYRTLQWMVTAGIAHKVDFGEGRSRFEPSLRHPRHFHLVCTNCHRSSEFLSSDIEAILEEVAAARQFEPVETVIQVYGLCEECRTGAKTPTLDGAATELVFARDALRIAVATERSGLEFYSRAAAMVSDPRGKEVFERLAEEEKHHLGTLEQRYAELIAGDPTLEARPTFLFFKGAAHGIFAEGAERLRTGVDDLQALLIGIRCERDSHKFFKKYGDRFEDSEGKQIFLEFAQEERDHRDLLIREYRKLQERLGVPRRRPPAKRAPSTH